MNEIFNPAAGLPAPQRPTTQAADGLPRWHWTTAEIERIAAAGYFSEHDRFELLGGEIVPMSPKGRRHEIVRIELQDRFTRLAPFATIVASEPQFNLGSDTYAVPDILVHLRATRTPDLRGADALLVVEVADTSLAYDLDAKAALYAANGVREYWVINANALTTTVHRKPSGKSYALIRQFAPDAQLVPEFTPELAVTLASLSLD